MERRTTNTRDESQDMDRQGQIQRIKDICQVIRKYILFMTAKIERSHVLTPMSSQFSMVQNHREEVLNNIKSNGQLR